MNQLPSFMVWWIATLVVQSIFAILLSGISAKFLLPFRILQPRCQGLSFPHFRRGVGGGGGEKKDAGNEVVLIRANCYPYGPQSIFASLLKGQRHLLSVSLPKTYLYP